MRKATARSAPRVALSSSAGSSKNNPANTQALASAQALNQLWTDFVQARTLAEASHRLEDGIRAGRAWAGFLSAFIESPPIVPEAP
jgi:hypothetical protein